MSVLEFNVTPLCNPTDAAVSVLVDLLLEVRFTPEEQYSLVRCICKLRREGRPRAERLLTPKLLVMQPRAYSERHF